MISFAGKGVFTAWDIRAAHKVAVEADWIAVQVDGVAEDGRPFTSAQDVADLRAAGARRVHSWYSFDKPAPLPVDSLGLDAGSIGQAEGPGQRDKALALGCAAMVGNLFMDVWPIESAPNPALPCIAECYWNVVEQNSPGSITSNAWNRGAKGELNLLYGIGGPWGEAFRVVSLADYLTASKGVVCNGFSIYLAEFLNEADTAAFRAATVVPPMTTTTPLEARAQALAILKAQIERWRAMGISQEKIALTRIWKAYQALL